MSTTVEKGRTKPDTKTSSTQIGYTRSNSAKPSNGTKPRQLPSPPSAPKQSTETTWQILFIPVDQIGPNPFQPRLTFDPVEMEELVASVKARGVQQPVIVRTAKASAGDKSGQSDSNDKATAHTPSSSPLTYELVAGERRLRACRQANKKWIPAIVRDDLSDAEAAELALLENVQRSNLSCIEEARGYKRLMLEFRLKEERLAKKVGKSVSTIKELMKLLQLPESVQTLLGERKLSAAHGYALLTLASFERLCLLVAHRIIQDKLTATSLQSTPLPNAKELKAKGLLVELDHKTKFSWSSTCNTCPFKAYVRSGYSSYCLKPEEWEKKQLVALEFERQGQEEAAQVMEQARQDNSVAIETSHLTPGSYRDLSFNDPPSGCSPQCACYREIEDPNDPTKKRPICLDPNRFKSLLEAQREAEDDARRRQMNALWEAAQAKLSADVQSGEWKQVVMLTVLPTLRAMYDQHGYSENWQRGVQEIAEELEIRNLDDFLYAEDESESYTALEDAVQSGLQIEKLLLLCALLLLAQEAREAVRFVRDTPGLDFVLGNRQGTLEHGLTEPDIAEPNIEEPDAIEEIGKPNVQEENDEKKLEEEAINENNSGEEPSPEELPNPTLSAAA